MTDTQQEIQIRGGVLDDAEALVSLLNPIIEGGTTALDTMLTVADERDYIASLPERAIFLVRHGRSTERSSGAKAWNRSRLGRTPSITLV
jgi:hypothetical protein